jgi:hypothetical protein
LTVDKFIIGTTSGNVARDQERYEIKKTDSVKFRPKTGNSSKVFARVHELRESRDTCRFCELISKAIERYSHGNIIESTPCSITWEVDGRQVGSGSGNGYTNSTRRIRLSWSESNGNSQEVYLVFVAPKDPLRPNSDARSRWEQETHFLGREFGDQKEKQALIKSWLDMCTKDHGEVCIDRHGTEREFMELIKETYFGVIDVADMQLKALPIDDRKPARYVALSYVWGRRSHDDPPFTTTRANVMTHILHGGLETAWEKLPRTIQDAILLVSRLGERYLWIDSLCIVQDSFSSWQHNAKAMHLVYGNAYFTICAADGDSSVGLRAVQPILGAMRPQDALRQRMTNMNLSGAQSSEEKEQDGSRPMSAECATGVRLMVTRPLEAVVNDSVWNKRAWTFQERILSRRCLVFAEGRVYFQCRTTGISQDIYTDGKGSGWSLDRTNSPLRTLREFQERPLWFYMKYVRMYTGRHLTKPRDILAAFEGISWVLERYMQAPSLFGIPTSHFDLALLWAPLNALRRRQPKTAANSKHSCTQDDMGNCTCQIESEAFGGKEFPSWAWSGWMDGTVEYQQPMIEDCLLNVREWHKYHTWIQWHIRDEKGHIRPLWEIFSPRSRDNLMQPPGLTRSYSRPGSFEDEDRWKGYPGKDRRRSAMAKTPRRPEYETPRRSEYDDEQSYYYEDDTIDRRHVRIRSPSPSPSPPPSPRPRRYPRSPEEEDYIDARERRSRAEPPLMPAPLIKNRIYGSQPRPRSYERVDNKSYLEHGSRVERSPPPPNSHRRSSYDNGYERVDNTDYIHRRSGNLNESFREVERVDNEHYIRKGSRRSRPSESDYEERRKTDSELVMIDNHSPPPTHREDLDDYGRAIRAEIPKETRPFHAILPDNPFGVIRENYFPQDPSKVRHMPVLQFWTWRTELCIGIREVSAGTATKLSGSGLCQCDIVDKEGDWCGSIVLVEEWIRERQGSLFQFIAISDAKAFAQEECPVWTYYIPKERDESDWDLYYVLLLERNAERGVWERAGLGKVFQAAFREKTWDEIKLG